MFGNKSDHIHSTQDTITVECFPHTYFDVLCLVWGFFYSFCVSLDIVCWLFPLAKRLYDEDQCSNAGDIALLFDRIISEAFEAHVNMVDMNKQKNKHEL